MSGASAFSGLFGTTDRVLSISLDDLSEEQARERPRGEGGPSIAWTVGHLLNYRVVLLNGFGVETPNPYAEHFGQEAATDGEGYPTIAQLQEAWEALAEPFAAAIGRHTDEELAEPLDDPWRPGETLGDRIAFMAWHESYHMGALGQIRKSLGLMGPAEKMMAARQAAEEG